MLVIERHESYGRETSSHNSGVIHAGIYYPFGSLKHRACIEGNPALYAWCERHGVEHRRSGKLIVALDDAERDALDAVAERARGNGVPGVSRLTRAEANALEPAVPAVAALRSASSGVVDQIGLVRSFEAAAREAGALFAYRHEVLAAERDGGGFRLELRDPDGERATLRSAALVNAAGHGAPAIAAALGYPLDGAGSGDGEGDGDVPRLRQTANRGRYYDVVGPGLARAVRHLIYPLPDHAGGGLGVHLTVDTDGALHLGPDTAWLDADAPLDYRADDAPRAAFLASGRRLLPALRDEDLAPGPGRLPPQALRRRRGGRRLPRLARPRLRAPRRHRVARPHELAAARAARRRPAPLSGRAAGVRAARMTARGAPRTLPA